MRKVLTEIEKLDGRFPGLAVRVKRWFDDGHTSAEIAALLREECDPSITDTMVENFRYKRWVPEKERHTLKVETAHAAVEAIGGEGGFDTLVLAKLWELMDKMSIPQLLSARSLSVKIKAQNLKEQEFLFKTGQLKPHQSPQEEEAERQAQSKNALRRIKEIFGLAGDEPPKPPVRQVPAVAGTPSA